MSLAAGRGFTPLVELSHQLEYYLSDDNLSTDEYTACALLLHGGTVPLLFLATYKRCEQRLRKLGAWLDADERLATMQQAVRMSATLRLCGAGCACVRRPTPLPPEVARREPKHLPPKRAAAHENPYPVAADGASAASAPAPSRPPTSFLAVLLPAAADAPPIPLRLRCRADYLALFGSVLRAPTVANVVLASKGREHVGPKLYTPVHPAAALGRQKAWGELGEAEAAAALELGYGADGRAWDAGEAAGPMAKAWEGLEWWERAAAARLGYDCRVWQEELRGGGAS